MIEAGASCNNDVRSGIALDERKQGESFGRDLRVGQDIFDRGKFCFRQEERIRLPVEQTLVEQFLGMNARAEDPNRLVDVVRERGDEKRLRRINDVRKRDRPRLIVDLGQFGRDRRRLRDQFEQIARFFHGECSPKAAELQKSRDATIRARQTKA